MESFCRIIDRDHLIDRLDTPLSRGVLLYVNNDIYQIRNVVLDRAVRYADFGAHRLLEADRLKGGGIKPGGRN